MSVHYKFKSALEYDTVTFDGLHISVKDLKNAIIQQKRIGKNTDFDLQVTNAQTKEVYEDENVLIPKNTSLLIARIPTSVQNKSKNWEGYGGDSTPPAKVDEGGPIAKAVDLSSLDAPEDDKIKAMMSQSTQDYDPSNYMKIRGANQMGAVPPNYRCYKCHQTGHWIKDCPLGQGPEPIEIKKSTGIPRSFMVPVDGPQVQGAMMTPNGSYAVPVLDHQAYTQKTAPAAPVPETKTEIPEDLLCSICSDLLTDAVMIPCCGNSFCDECIRSCLLESEEHECPDCHEKDISPGTLIPNRFLRTSVATFKNTTGYVKKPVYKEKNKMSVDPVTDVTATAVKSTTAVKSSGDSEEKTVISEADSTEHSKTVAKDAEPVKSAESSESFSEGPPGVSPKHSPKQHRISNRVNSTRERLPRNSTNGKARAHEHSPRKSHRTRRSPNYTESGDQEDRPGTPTVDEPGMGNYPPTTSGPQYNNGPPGTIPSMLGMTPSLQGPPTNLPPTGGNYGQVQVPPMGGFPPTHGPPPNFRLPPPGAAPPYMPGTYPVAPRPMFDANRPPMTGPPPGFPPNFPPNSRSHHGRDFPPNRRIRDRTPPGIIDDPLTAFNKMLREKDERERRFKQRNLRRSYSRSRSRSRSYSRSPRRMRSRSPRRRQSRSRSRSFSISRSRSRSYSGGSLRGSPPYRQISPPPRRSPPPLPSRRGPSRYRSPVRSPPRHHRPRDFDHNRDYGRDDRPPFSARDKDMMHRRDNRDDRDGGRYYDNYDDRRGGHRQWGGPSQSRGPPPSSAVGNDGGGSGSGYYPEMQQGGYQNNRYQTMAPSQRDYPPPQFMGKSDPGPPPPHHAAPLIPHLPVPRRFDDIAPPGVEEPPVPGLEPVPRFDRYEQRQPSPIQNRDSDKYQKTNTSENTKITTEKPPKRRHEKRSRTPDKLHRNPSPKKRSRSKDLESPDKHKRRRRDPSSDRDEREKKRTDHSDDEKSRKSKEKKKRKDKKESDKKKKKDKKERHKKDSEKERKPKEESKPVVEKITSKIPEEFPKTEPKEQPKTPEQQIQEEVKADLYEDILADGVVDRSVVENYGKISEDVNNEVPAVVEEHLSVPEEIETKEYEDSEKDILELHSSDMDLKAELEKNEVLAPVPEKSKWEVEEEISSHSSPRDLTKLEKSDKTSGKVTNEVLKRAENAIFAKAINAIRPIEIKISTDRAKLYSGERDVEKTDNKLQITVPVPVEITKKSATSDQPVQRISVKDRLGVKVEDDPDRNRSRSLSPFSKRGDLGGRNFSIGERRVEIEERKHRRSRSRRRESSRDRHRRHDDHRRPIVSRSSQPIKRRSNDRHDSRNPKTVRVEEEKKRRRSRSNSSDRKDRRKKKDRKTKKDKSTKKPYSDEQQKDSEEQRPKVTTDKRKATLDEASFEPDYDLESESDKEAKQVKEVAVVKKDEDKGSSSSDSSSSSSEDDKKSSRKKYKKHRKKKKKESSSSSSDSDSDSSDDEKEKRRKKHKKQKKKRKKSKHK